jgi:hypothetical protein
MGLPRPIVLTTRHVRSTMDSSNPTVALSLLKTLRAGIEFRIPGLFPAPQRSRQFMMEIVQRPISIGFSRGPFAQETSFRAVRP